MCMHAHADRHCRDGPMIAAFTTAICTIIENRNTVFFYVYIYIYIHACIHVCVCVALNYVLLYVYMYIQMCVCMYVCMYVLGLQNNWESNHGFQRSLYQFTTEKSLKIVAPFPIILQSPVPSNHDTICSEQLLYVHACMHMCMYASTHRARGIRPNSQRAAPLYACIYESSGHGSHRTVMHACMYTCMYASTYRAREIRTQFAASSPSIWHV